MASKSNTWNRLDVERVVGVVEEVGVASALDPLRQPAGEGAWKQVRQGEEPPLRRVEDVEVLDRFVQLAVFGVAQPIAVGALPAARGRTRAGSAGSPATGSSANGLMRMSW